MKVFFIRHGETEESIKQNALPILTSKGKKQIDELAKRLSKLKLDLIYSSDLDRAKITAEEIHKYNLGAKLIFSSDLQEIYRILIGGQPKPNESQNRAENDKARSDKFWKLLINLAKENIYNNICVVCHGNLIRYYLAKTINKSPKNFYFIEIDPASVSIVDFDAFSEEKRIVLVNDIAHLSLDLVSDNSKQKQTRIE